MAEPIVVYVCRECVASKPCILTLVGLDEHDTPPDVCPITSQKVTLTPAKWEKV